MNIRTILIRYLIRTKYITQTACAHSWGVTRQYVSLIAQGRRPVPWWAREDLGL